MILTIYVIGMEEPLAREVCTLEEARIELSNFGSHRLEKIIITDLRPVYKEIDGKKTEICPDF